jgi:cobalt-zinc-cadmium efflux system protein
LGLTLGYAFVEAIGGWLSGSLALLSDAGHMLTDASALGLGLVAARIALRSATGKLTYGFQRAEIIGALVNVLFMIVVVAFIGYEAVERLADPQPVAGGAVMLVATVGLVVNIIAARVLHSGEQNLNTRGAFLHVLGDLLGSVGAILAGVVIYFTGWLPVDPLLSLAISVLILLSSLKLLRDILRVFMEGVPPHLDFQEIGEAMAAVDGVLEVHDLHVWAISSGTASLTAHLQVRDLRSWPRMLKELRNLLAERFGIEHVTLQPETPPEIPLRRDLVR